MKNQSLQYKFTGIKMKKMISNKAGSVQGVVILVLIPFIYFAVDINNDQLIEETKKPTIVILLADDQGYADVSYHDHPKEIFTPAIDRLAREGVVFTNGYASGYVCAPTRAGLLTGRYQQRFGFYRASDSRAGMPLTEKTLANYLKEEGYKTGIFGKWHLGLEYDYRPLQRGFDEFYGFLGHGAHDYFDLACHEDSKHNCIYRNNEIINDEGYLTDNLAREACDFIKRHAGSTQPFFLYLPFNAVHWPLQAPAEDIAKFDTGDADRDIMLGMLHRMDIAIGRVYETLKSTGAYENTLLFYFSDNGGAAKIHANNSPLRDYKQSTYEGGVRVPFIVSWPGVTQPGVADEPVISLDILPTILEAIGKELPGDRVFDGKSMMPIFEGDLEAPLHDQLVWDGDEGRWAIRQGDHKLVMNRQGNIELYNLNEDVSESKNIKDTYFAIANKLEASYNAWRSEMGEPMQRNR
jgi:arylsulfatase A-like enzyme